MFFVVLDNIRSLENVGSIFRTADALRVDKIFLCGITASGHGIEKIKKTALGAEKEVAFERKRQTWRVIEDLKKRGFQIIALEKTENSIDYLKIKPRFPIALVLGNEKNGVSRAVLEKADKVICLPMLGKKESLNVAVAFGVAGYELLKHRKP